MRMPLLKLVLLICATHLACAGADVLDRLGIGKKKEGTTGLATPTLPQDQLILGLKEALGKGLEQSIQSLGKEGGFLKDASVKIPLPDSLAKIEKTLKTLKQDKLANDFISTMNTAAEKAVPAAASVIGDSIKQLSIADAKGILAGTNNAATAYFRRTSEASLRDKFLPIVKTATAAVGVTQAYKQMMAKVPAGGFGISLLGKDNLDLDAYVTQKALDGLFSKIAEEEKRIRETPAARSTELLKSVFNVLK